MSKETGLSDVWAQLRFDRTVPRGLVHRAAVAEVLITDALEPVEGVVRFAAQWPAWHPYFAVGGERPDAAIVAETLRQATIYLARRFFGAAESAAFLMNRLMVSVAEVELPAGVGPRDIHLAVEVREVVHRGAHLRSLTTVARFESRGVLVAEGLGELGVIPGAVHRKLREGVAAVGPSTRGGVAEDARRSCLLADGDRAWLLLPPVANATIFDHDLDHLPGMAVLEATRQAALGGDGGDGGGVDGAGDGAVWFSGFDASFGRFLDAGRTSRLVRTDDGPADALRQDYELEQDGLVAVRARVSLTPREGWSAPAPPWRDATRDGPGRGPTAG